jgi:BMFP domain-containing protein YqiC
MDMRKEMEGIISVQVEKFLQKLNLVTKEEFDTAQAMIAKARTEQEELKKRLEALEEQLVNLGKKAKKE